MSDLPEETENERLRAENDRLKEALKTCRELLEVYRTDNELLRSVQTKLERLRAVLWE